MITDNKLFWKITVKPNFTDKTLKDEELLQLKIRK